MKTQLLKMVKWFSMRNELAAANSYINCLQNELNVQRETAMQAVRELAAKDVEILSMGHELSAAHARVVSAKERYFLKVCKNIYSNGKMISEMRFRGMVGAMIGEWMHENPEMGMSADNGNKNSELFNK